MISIIICSRKKNIPKYLQQNIADTIGCEYDLVVINNSRNEYSIFSAYNEGIKQSKGDICCFLHDDVLFRSKEWGPRICRHFNDKSIGIIGFAGAHFLPSYPIYWDHSPFISEYNLTTNHGVTNECFSLDFFHGNLSDVVVCDGLCLFVRTSLFNYIKFDEDSFSGFHLYDMDICMQAQLQNSRVCVCKDILLEHFYNNHYHKKGTELFSLNLHIFYNKWKSFMPITRGMQSLSKEEERMLSKYIENTAIIEGRYLTISHSHAYQLGRKILSPLRILKH